MAFFAILWCSHFGDHTQEEFTKFGYMSERNMVTLAQKPFVCIRGGFFFGLPSGKNLPPKKCWLHSNFLTLYLCQGKQHSYSKFSSLDHCFLLWQNIIFKQKNGKIWKTLFFYCKFNLILFFWGQKQKISNFFISQNGK
jgi:hypothetical protein